MKHEYKRRSEYKLFWAGAIFALVVLFALVFILITPWTVQDFVKVCYFKKYYGFYCPGCGGTRSVLSFLKGSWLNSLYYHAFVPYCGILYLLFMVRGGLSIASRGTFSYMKFRYGYLYVGIAILLVQFVLKNLSLIRGYQWLN